MNSSHDKIKEYFQNIKSLEINHLAFIFFFFPFILKVFWPAYFFLGLHTLVKVKKDYLKSELSLVILTLAFLLLKFLQAPSIQTVQFFKTFLGLYFFYFYFKYINKVILTKALLLFSSFLLMSEFSLNLINNIPQFARRVLEIAYPRPLGMGGNATITSIILITFFITFYGQLKRYFKGILIFDLLISGSGMGYLGILYVLIIKKIKPKFKVTPLNAILLTIVLLSYFYFYYYVRNFLYVGNPVYKMSPLYFIDLISMKLGDIRYIFADYSIREHIWGLSWKTNLLAGGDFGWRDVYQMCGIGGVLYYLVLIQKICKNREVKFLVLFSMFHYGIIWWPAGQIFMGYLFSRISLGKQQGEKSEAI